MQSYYDRTNRNEPNLAERRNTYSLNFLAHQPVGGRQKVTWGFSGRFSHADNPVVVSGFQFLPQQRTDNLFTAFFQDEIVLVDNRLSFIAGTKRLRTNFTGITFQPSARLLWTPSDRQDYSGRVHARRPNAFGRRREILPFRVRGHHIQWLAIDGAFQCKRSICPRGAQQLRIWLPAAGNGLLATTKGLEAAPEWRPTDRWRLRGTYSYLYMNVYKAPHSGDLRTARGIVGASPQHEATVQSFFEISRALLLDLTCPYVSQLPAQSVPAYSTGDARISWRFAPKLELSLVGRNLFQPHHPEYAGYPNTLIGIGRGVFTTLAWGG